ncbi:hypothetical protein NLU13_7670 [Sarocladium strictum]|uniref:Xylanolytic transcriptional activator regulatory domain-containing protein n=1 Tax=Sarocladium strictum TaxID=5046 RepID=A0AA39GD84_SARSR|nr:hypothetical protein NLU13_7670 [Sarocladium strictum]
MLPISSVSKAPPTLGVSLGKVCGVADKRVIHLVSPLPPQTTHSKSPSTQTHLPLQLLSPSNNQPQQHPCCILGTSQHYRLSKHDGDGDNSTTANVVLSSTETDFDRAAAAESLSCLSGVSCQQWPTVNDHPHSVNDVFGHVDTRHVNDGAVRDAYHQSPLGPQMFTAGDDLTGFDQFREFADFLDGIGLPAEWSPYFNPPEDFVDPELRNGEASNGGSGPGTRPGTPFSSWLPSAPAGNRITGPVPTESPRAQEIASILFKVTDEQSLRLNQSLEDFRRIIDPGFRLPSRHALTRYVTSYFEGFHTHMVFIHVPTWRILDCPVELVLSIAAIGAQYCFEHRASERLFRAGRAILLERLLQRKDEFGPKTCALLGMQTPSCQDAPLSHQGPWEPIDSVRALINLMAFATWEPKVHLVQDAFSLQGLLAQVLRDLGLEEDGLPDEPANSTSINAAWLAWAQRESIRRSKLIAFSFIHVHSIAYNVYPALRTNELHLRLPCETKEWKAPTAQLWQSAHREVSKQQLYFQEALSLLLRTRDSAVPLNPIPTALGNYLLLHGLLQRIYIVRDLSLPITDSSASLPVEEVDKLE